MIKKIIIKINYSILFFALTHIVNAQDSTAIQQISEPLIHDKEVTLPYNIITQRQKTGSVIVIDVEAELKRDQARSIEDIINGKVPGVFGGTNTWSTGGATILVDGIRQSSFYISTLNLMEVESVVILKDALSTAMYGAQGDNGVILVNTKRGKAGKHEVRVAAQYSYIEPRDLPNYLNAADYMSRYNEAQFNDGVDIGSLRYPQETIDATRSGENPTRYPDNDFYSNDYIKENTRNVNVFADISGGSDKVRYYTSTEWTNSNGWLNTPQADVTNLLNFRGNLDFEINDYLDMSINTTGRFSFNTRPNTGSIWNVAANELPNNYPVLWDPNLITDVATREFILSEANLINGQVLGGTSTFLNNPYGNLTQKGNSKFLQREVQFGLKLNMDMRFITKGLSSQFYGGMNFFNSLYTNQDPDFAVYQPIFNDLTGGIDDVIVHGQDKQANRYNTNPDNSTFFRQISYYGTLNYNRSFGKHAIAATGLVNTDIMTNENQLQKDVLFQTGVSANYMFNKKYIFEMSLMGIGSRKLKEGNRIEPALSVGYGWVLSEEDFIPETSFIDYLKIRTSYGVTKNDNWGDYFLYRNAFQRGDDFNYNNDTNSNQETNFLSVPNTVKLQRRRDFTFGLDAMLFDKAMSIQLGYFKSESLDNITLRNFSSPEILGYDRFINDNYNSTQTQGLELGLNYKFDVASDFSITPGANLLYISPKWLKREEPFYQGADAALLREGTPTDALWGLKSNGLYGETDFNLDGTLVNGLPVPDFGDVQPGDIKYLDQNADGVINAQDERVIGHGQRTQYSLYLDLKYKNLELYILGIGSMGDSDYRSGSYFRVDGDVKYSDQANFAYGPNNKNVNAIHPRLSTTNVSNNDRNSDFWIYKDNSFAIPTMQLTYNLEGLKESSVLKDARVFVRSNNALILGKNKKYSEINVGGTPRTRSITLGLITSF